MSTSHNNARRHRQLLKKRVSNDLNVNDLLEKRVPQFGFVNAPADTPPTGGNALPPIGSKPVPSSPSAPVGPTTNPTAVSSKPAPPATTAQTQTTPKVPISPTTSSSSSVATSLTSSSSLLSSSTTSLSSTSTTQLPTVVAPPTQVLPTTSGLTYTAPASFSIDGTTPSGTSPAVSGTSTSSSTSNDLSTGSIVGIVAAGLIALVAVTVVGMWLTKRYFKSRDEAEFDRNSFIRQSVHIPDEEENHRPRPPTMIERHRGAYGAQQAAYGNNMYAPPVPPMPTIHPGEMMMADQATMANPFAASPIDHYGAPMHQQPALVRVPSNGSSHSYNDPNGHYQQYPSQIQNMAMEEHAQVQGPGYANLERTSVTPYQAAQYAEISRQLNISSVANSPISPSFGQGGYGGEHNLSIDTGRLPTPSPQRAMSPQGSSPQRMMSPLQRVMSPNSVPVGGYSFPMPLSNSPPAAAPASVAHAAAMAALGVKPGSSPQAGSAHLHPQEHAHEGRPVTLYEEDDAYGGM